MLRNRLIFGLIYSDGAFMQSRNFRLQRVGDINWLERNYKFQKISFSLDELVVVNATRKDKDIASFAKLINRISNKIFIPIAAGGGIRCLDDVDLLFKNGADKVILNSAVYESPDLVEEIVKKYGSQSLVASVDYKFVNQIPKVFIRDGTKAIDINIEYYLKIIQEYGIGEIILNSIDKDGTGFGYDIETISQLSSLLDIPLIIMGGAGNEIHLKDGLEIDRVSGVATANLFNFIGNGLPNAREYLLTEQMNLARWINADT